MQFHQRPLAMAMNLFVASVVMTTNALAQGEPANAQAQITVITVLGVDENAGKIVAPFSIMDQKELFDRGGTLGDLLNGLPGVHADTFGGGASRPVVRGQTAPRVKILSDSSTLLDASDISPDHAITADPLLAQRVEVLRGPATLLYGGGAIGGVINILDARIPTALPANGAEGFAGMRTNSVANEKAAALSFTGAAGRNFAVHAETSLREADAYKAAGGDGDRVDGTFAENGNASVGAAWIGEKGYLGVAYSLRGDDYGLPGHNHEYEGCHPHSSEIHCGSHAAEEEHDHEDEEEHAEVPLVDLNSRRVDLRGEFNAPLPGIHRVRIRANRTDYQHRELEEGVVSTTFRNEGYEGRVEFDHAPLFGWHGVVGAQLADTEFSALGAEAFIPRTESESYGVFAVEHFEVNERWHLEAGARHEQQQHKPVGDPRNRPAFDGTANSFSGAVIWTFNAGHTLALTLSEAQRLPHAQELYARGVHLATNTYECGAAPHPLTCGGLENNAPLRKEESSNIELTLRRDSGDFSYSFNLFSNDVDNYFYARTLDQFEDFRLIKYTQQDAEFQGLEAELSYRVSDTLAATVFGDYVRAEFASGGNLPRISPRRVGGRINAQFGSVTAQVEYFHVSTQDDIAAYEVATPGYNMLNATLSFKLLGDENTEVFVRGSNLLDDEVWSHSSFLASVVPLPGLNLSAGIQYAF